MNYYLLGEIMAFKSKAQRQRCIDLVSKGEMSQEDFDKHDADTPEELPEHTGYRPITRRGPNKYKHFVKEVEEVKPIKIEE
jgi:hypothetical protein